MLLQEPPVPAEPGQNERLMQLGESLLGRIIYYLNYPFINQKEFKVSILSILLLIVVVVVASLLSRYARRILEKRVMARVAIDSGLQYTLLRIFHYLLISLGLLYGLKLGFGVDLTSVAVILGFLSVGIGFGLQHIASDLVSGFILLFERPVRVNDRIKIDDVEGRVASISLRVTVIITNDNMAIFVPNSELIRNKFINWSYGRPQRVRIRLPVGVSYGSDLAKVTNALIQAGKSVSEVLETPPPKVQFRSFGDSSLDFELLVWIDKPHNHPQIRSTINYEIVRQFRANNIEIPFPQRDLHLRSGGLNLRRNGGGHELIEATEAEATPDAREA